VKLEVLTRMPFCHAFFAQVCAPRPGGDGDVGGQRLGGDAHCFGAVKRDRADVTGFQFVDAHHLAVRFHDGRLIVRHLHLKNVRGIEQPVGVLLQTENRRAFFGFISAQAFKYAHAVMQCVGQHMGGGIAPGDELAVIPDKTVAVGHRHNGGSFDGSVAKRRF